MNTNKKLYIVGGVIIIAIAAFFFANRVEAPAVSDTTTASSTDAGNIDLSTVSTTSVTHQNGYTITPLPIDNTATAPKAPDYTASVAFKASVGADVRTAVATQLADIKSILDKNSKDIDAWLRLGTLHKIGGDYAGAETMWLYVSKAWPADYIAFNNLADLYRTEGKTADAKAMYKLAIEKAKAAGKTELATQMEADLAAIK